MIKESSIDQVRWEAYEKKVEANNYNLKLNAHQLVLDTESNNASSYNDFGQQIRFGRSLNNEPMGGGPESSRQISRREINQSESLSNLGNVFHMQQSVASIEEGPLNAGQISNRSRGTHDMLRPNHSTSQSPQMQFNNMRPGGFSLQSHSVNSMMNNNQRRADKSMTSIQKNML